MLKLKLPICLLDIPTTLTINEPASPTIAIPNSNLLLTCNGITFNENSIVYWFRRDELVILTATNNSWRYSEKYGKTIIKMSIKAPILISYQVYI